MNSLASTRNGVYTVCMRRVNIHLTEQQITALRALAHRTGLTVAELIRRAIDVYLKEDFS